MLEEVKLELKLQDGENRRGNVRPMPRPRPNPQPNPEEEKVTGPPQCFVPKSRIHRFVCPATDIEEVKKEAKEAMEAANEARARAKKSVEAQKQAEARAKKAADEAEIEE